MTDHAYNVLFLCTGNSARSIMAEAMLSVRSKGRFKGYSAGSHPTGKINPFALELVTKLAYPTEGLRSKSWDEFAAADAPHMDFIITVCDSAAGEVCPVWPGRPTTAHWGFPDPAAVQGSDDEKRKAFHDVYLQIARRVDLFLALPHDKIDRLALQSQVKAIGQT